MLPAMAAVASFTEQLTGKPRVTYEEFLALPDDLHAEWVDGEVVPMPSVSLAHADLVVFLVHLLRLFAGRDVGRVLSEPFQLRAGADGPGRSPDVMFVLKEHFDRIRDLFVEGPADLVIEIVSPSSVGRDYVEKFREYEAARVPEYWVLDPDRREASFFVLEGTRFERATVGSDGVYRSPAVAGLALRPAWFWEQPSLREMLELLGGS
jgi:Uma2 family endonuclease